MNYRISLYYSLYDVPGFKNSALFNFMKEKTSAMCAPYCCPTSAIHTMNLHKSTLIIIVMRVNMFDVSYDIA